VRKLYYWHKMRIGEFGERPLNLYLLCVELQSFLQYSEEVFATSRYLQPSLLTGAETPHREKPTAIPGHWASLKNIVERSDGMACGGLQLLRATVGEDTFGGGFCSLGGGFRTAAS
jgi:hypothetical protein